MVILGFILSAGQVSISTGCVISEIGAYQGRYGGDTLSPFGTVRRCKMQNAKCKMQFRI